MAKLQEVPKIERNYALLGGISGIAVCMFLQPLEVIQMGIIINPTRSLVIENSSFLKSFQECTKLIKNREGFSGFWRGITPALIRGSLGSGSYFLALTELEQISHLRNQQLTNYDHFINSAFSRMISTLIINPFAVVGSRFEVPFIKAPYQNMKHAFNEIYHQEGMNAFLKGSLTCILQQGMFGGIYYMIYNNIKDYGVQNFQVNYLVTSLTAGLIAGWTATAITNPLEVIRARLQVGSEIDPLQSHNYKGVIDGYRNIVQNEGTIGLFQGLGPRLLRKPLSNSMTFVFFEFFVQQIYNQRW